MKKTANDYLTVTSLLWEKREVEKLRAFLYNWIKRTDWQTGSYGGVGRMKLADLSNGPDWIVWAAFIVVAILSAVFISGHGSGLISGYNVASKEEKAKYNEKRLCRTMGIGMAVIACLILISELFENVLPANFAYVLIGVIIADVIGIVIFSNTICKK